MKLNIYFSLCFYCIFIQQIKSFMVPNPFQIVRFNSTYVDLHFNHKISTLMRWTPMNFSLLQHNKHNGVDDSNVCILHINSTNSTITLNTPLTVNVSETILTKFLMNSQPTWFLYSLDTFSSNEEAMWTMSSTSSCGPSSDIFLGGHCKLGGTSSVQRTYTNLLPHKSVRLTARVHFLDEWLGESLLVMVDQLIRWTKNNHWCNEVLTSQCLKKGLDICGNTYPDLLSTKIDVSFPHSHSNLTVKFFSTLQDNRKPCEVSWGIDDVAVYLMN